ncbi:hypothetical protein J7J90_00240 [Candidatus Micrarchaeota archaeon]|nr:hypothetical protein [Candidatus Micrarchaeota archaeon]
MKIYVIGNPLVYEDSLALKIGKRLKIKGWDVETADPLELIGKEGWIVLDVGNVKDIIVYDSEELANKVNTKSITAHDLDLGTVLQVMATIGGKGKVIIIPMELKDKDEDKIMKDVEEILWTLKRSD